MLDDITVIVEPPLPDVVVVLEPPLPEVAVTLSEVGLVGPVGPVGPKGDPGQDAILAFGVADTLIAELEPPVDLTLLFENAIT